MFDIAKTITPSPSKALRDLRCFASENANALVCAAALLGAAPGVRTALTALDGLSAHGRPTERTLRAFDDLIDLLMLENAHDPHRIEAVCLAALDPAEPVTEEIYLLADGLGDVLETYRKSVCEPNARGAVV